MSEVIKVNVDEFLETNYLEYGRFVNFNRVIPGIDGLKPVHRRILMALREVASGKLTSTVNAIGTAQKLHPFGDLSIIGVISDMARIKAIDSQGEFGARLLETIDAAAPRYTKVGLSREQLDYYFKLIKYSPTHEGEELVEPQFLLTPVPYALMYGGLNWGLGIISRTPAFTYESLIDAYFSNDYTKLVPQFGYQLGDKSDLKGLWETGIGRIHLKYKVIRIDDDNILIKGSGELFTPNIGPLQEWIDSGQISIANESDENVVLRVSRVYRARSVDMSNIFNICKSIAEKTRFYEIKVVNEGKISTLSIRDWLHITISLYSQYYQKSKEDRIAESQFKIKVLQSLPVVAKMIIEDTSDEELLSVVNDEEVISAIKKKSIGSLRKTDCESEIKSITNQIASISSEDPISVIKSFKW